MKSRLGGLIVASALLWLVPLGEAQAERVLVVPHSQKNTTLPHPVYEGARVTLKAALRDATCGSYDVWWDADRDGDFDDDARRTVDRDAVTRSVVDLGRTFQVPAVERDTSLNINVRVRSRCDDADVFATYRMFVYDFAIGADPRDWTPAQVEIARDMTLKETMWYLHRTQTGAAGYNVSTLTSRAPDWRASGLAMWLFTINGHLPAYPPGSINTYGRPLPDGWADANDARWNADPYAETAMRFANYLLAGRARLQGVEAGDESNHCGYDPDGSARTCNRIPGTTDNRGTIAVHHNVYYQGMNLGALATVLPALGGTPLQQGQAGVVGQTWEWYIQQSVDYLGWEQIDGGCAGGGWYYYRAAGNRTCGYSDGSTSQWAYIGLESAEQAGGPFGVFVNNTHKYRIANNLVNNQNGDGGAGYRNNSARSNLQLTGGSFVGARWLGLHRLSAGDGAVAFPGIPAFDEAGAARAPHTRGELRRVYDRYLSYTAANWRTPNLQGSHSGWISGLWQQGDYLCGDTDGADNQAACGNTYSIYSHQKGYRTGSPELEAVGANDWFRQFSIYYIRAQERALDAGNPLTGYSTFGRINDAWCGGVSVTCRWGRDYMNTAMAGLVLTPAIFNPNPVALADVVPAQVTEGCAGGNNGRVTFDHGESFHPNASGRIVAWQWDFDAENGLWWETGADPDFSTPGVDGVVAETTTHTYARRGTYTATLRVVDHVGQADELEAEIEVRASQNVPPSASSGGPYVLERGRALQLRALATDGNTGCGDALTLSWDLDGDGDFDDAQGATPVVSWQVLSGLQESEPHAVGFRAVDGDGEVVTAQTTLTIYPPDPVIVARATPNPAAPARAVTFDASASHHPNPERSIVQVQWDVDGRDGWDGGGPLLRYTYQRFGSYDVTVQVIDDLGRTTSETFRVQVNQGNRPPVARTSRDVYVVVEGADLALDARLSSDPDEAYGDALAELAWDVDDDGAFDGALDARGERAIVGWSDLVRATGFDGDAQQIGRDGDAHFVTLRVTDTFGATHTRRVQVVIFPARPRALVEQVPKPAPIHLQTGLSRVSFDARGSFSPVPGGRVVRFDWDFDNDGDIDVANAPLVELVRVYDDPVPGPEDLPEVDVRLIVTDDAGRTSDIVYRVVYRVPPTPPHADADQSDPPERGYHILAGEGVTLDASRSSDPDAEDFGDFIQVYRWDLTYEEDAGFEAHVSAQDEDGDGDEARIAISANRLAQLGLDAPGTFTVALEVEDTTLLTNLDTTTLTVHPRAPAAAIVGLADPVAPGVRLSIDGGGSAHSHPDVDVVSWAWDLDGDGDFDDAAGRSVTHVFQSFGFDGPERVGLRATDSNGNTDVVYVEVPVTAGNRPPAAQAGGHRDADGAVDGPYILVRGDALQLDAGGSTEPDADFGDAIVRYQWDIGNDGGFDVEGLRPDQVSWNQLVGLGLGEAGNHQVRMVVTDRLGATTASLATVLVVNGPSAVAIANPMRTGCERQVEFDGSRSTSDAPAEHGFALVGFAWDLDGDGLFDDARGPRVTRPVVALPGEDGRIRFPVALRVTDEAGHTDTDEIEVIIDVDNLRPVANAGGPYATGPVGDGYAPVRLDGRASIDPNAPCDRLVTYKWDTDGDGLFGADDAPADRVGAVVPDFVSDDWRVGLVQTVGLVVCDLAGACSDPAEADIAVGVEAPPAGQLVGPRAGDDDACVGAGQRDIVIQVADPEGDAVTARIVVAGVEVAQRQIQTNADGSPTEVTLSYNANLVPEGSHEIEVLLDDGNGGEARFTSGGRLAFDRTGPSISIGGGPREGVCYAAGQVPGAELSVEDNLDDAPTLAQEVVADGCGRTLRVTATDACGNEGVAERGYLMADRLEADIDGAQAGGLVAAAEMSWSVPGPGGCASNVSARITRDGGDAQAYVAGTPIEAPGTYVLAVNVANCMGVSREQLRPFSVNAPPVAVPVRADDAARDPDRDDAYLVAQGDPLRLDGSGSRSPEDSDRVVRYEWDIDGDGEYDLEGEVVVFPTDVQRSIVGRLRVTDSLGATATAPFRVTVVDVDPTADPGGPYAIDQGELLVLDGRGSAGNAAEPIVLYAWDIDGDGEDDLEGARVEFTPQADGVRMARLRVRDRDSEDTATVRIDVRDVDPVIRGIDAPEDPYEIASATFTVTAEAGTDSDPLRRIEWDLDGDGEVDAGGVGMTRVSHRYRDAGRYTVVVKVFDIDSSSTHAINVDVRESTLAELLTHVGERVEAALEDQALSAQARFPLNGVSVFVARGLWAERHDQRGTTLVAIDTIITRLAQAQRRGADFGLELWALGRQLTRASHRLDAKVRGLQDGPDEQHPSLERAREQLDRVDERYGSRAFGDDARSDDRVHSVQELWADAFDTHYWFHDAIGPFADGFRVPDEGDAAERAAASHPVNQAMTEALRLMAEEMGAYANAGLGEDDTGPGREAVQGALTALQAIRSLQAHEVTNPCPEDHRCVTDEEATRLLLLGIEVANQLFVAAERGAYTRNWQHALVEMLAFRAELSLLRVEFVCGVNTLVSQLARATQDPGMLFVEDGEDAAALGYYVAPERGCLIRQTYNECLVPALGEQQNPPMEYPDVCSDVLALP